jgi:hypothetical protein
LLNGLYAWLRQIEQFFETRVDLRHFTANSFHPFAFLAREPAAFEKRVGDAFDSGERISHFVRECGGQFFDEDDALLL